MPKQYRDLENVVVNLPCSSTKESFEGTSCGKDISTPISLELTGADLCQNTMFVGTLGSGKTTSMNTMLQQLISYRSLEPKHKLGLFVFDSKLDETCQKVTEWAKRAGRLDDLVILSPTGDHYYELFQHCNTLAQVEDIATKLLSCSEGCTHSEDSFWQESRRPILLMGLVLEMVGGRLTFSKALKALQKTIIEGDVADERKAYDELRGLVDSGVVPETERNIINQVLSTYTMWRDLDSRTKGIHAQVFSNNLQPLLSTQAQSYFIPAGGTGLPTRKPLDVQHVISEGKIVVVSVNAVRYPELASLLGRLIKADFYDAVQARQLAFNDTGRLVGLILDEYPLVVTGTQGRYGDVAQLQSMRSKRAFVVAATQGFTSLDLVVGARVREGLTLNFNNWFVMKSNESSVRFFLYELLPPPTEAQKFDWSIDNQDDTSIKPSNLAVNQAYVALTRMRAYSIPLWLKPTYFDGKISESTPHVELSFYDTITKARDLLINEKASRARALQKERMESYTPQPSNLLEAADVPEQQSNSTYNSLNTDNDSMDMRSSRVIRQPSVAQKSAPQSKLSRAKDWLQKFVQCKQPVKNTVQENGEPLPYLNVDITIAKLKTYVELTSSTLYSDLESSQLSDPFYVEPKVSPRNLNNTSKLDAPVNPAYESKAILPAIGTLAVAPKPNWVLRWLHSLGMCTLVAEPCYNLKGERKSKNARTSCVVSNKIEVDDLNENGDLITD